MPLVERVAIVGLSIRFPGCQADPNQFWDDVVNGRDCSSPVPPDRWLLPAELCYNERIPHPDSVYNLHGYYLDHFEPLLDDLDISHDLVQQLDPLFQLILDVGRRAYRSARMLSVDKRRVGVILGNICLPTNASSELAWEYLGQKPCKSLGLPAPQRATHPWNRYVAGLPAALMARALGLGGSCFTLDAACASSLYAIKLACDELLSGRADAMLAGGASRPDALYTQMGFSQLRALSPSGKCSPFDAQADGLVVGEGSGIFVLKRLSDALKYGDNILGVICGAGLSNDQHGNLLAPAKEGQLRAMNQAYELAGWRPTHPDMIECHATGTPVGDAVEFESLRELWGESGWAVGQCSIGSVKSTVGHLLTGAGSAALAKVLLAISAKVRPPQANFSKPASGLRYSGGPFRVLTEAEEWKPRRPTVPRRAAISGFGFGGVNGHLLVEEYVGQTYVTPSQKPSGSSVAVPSLKLPQQKPTRSYSTPDVNVELEHEIAIVGQAVHIGPMETLAAFQQHIFGHPASTPKPKVNGWGLATDPCPSGYFVEQLRVALDRYRIPPKEMEEMLPQQLLMLTTASAALEDCKGKDGNSAEGDPHTGVFIGLGLDLNTTNFHLRWMGHRLFHELGDNPNFTPEFEAELLDSISPALNANRTMGALGSITASRIARAFGFGGPSFTVCSEETSSMRALELAVRSLRSGELNRAIVGGVDLAGDPRALLSTAVDRPYDIKAEAAPFTQHSSALAGEGAVAIVLKRLEDAINDGDRVYAILKGVGSAVGGATNQVGTNAATYASSMMRACADATLDPAEIDYLETAATGHLSDDTPEAEAIAALLKAQARRISPTLSAVRGQVGQLGAASGLAGLVKASLVLQNQILPPGPNGDNPLPSLASVVEQCFWSSEPGYWLKDHSTTRRAMIASTSLDGTVSHAILEEFPVTEPGLKPLGQRNEGLFVLEADSAAELVDQLDKFASWIEPRTKLSIHDLAATWHSHNPRNYGKRRALTMVPRSTEELFDQILYCQECLQNNPDQPIPSPTSPEVRPAFRDRVFYNPNPLGVRAKIAYVYPGSGNHFAHMGQDLSVQWPQVLCQQQKESRRLRSQYAPQQFWRDHIPETTTARECLFGQVAVGTLGSDVLKLFSIRADALVGLSLGESAGLFGLRVWMERDDMLARIDKSTIFISDLAPPFRAARQFFDLDRRVNIEWVSGVLPVPADDVRAALRPGLKVYLLIVTTPNECVIGGLRADVELLLTQFDVTFFPLQNVTIAHCEVGRVVEAAYYEMHTLTVTPPPTLAVYSGASARPYRATAAACADSITAGLINTIDFPAVIESAYRDGVRVFLEVGPGNSCTRMITATLGTRPHVARAITAPRQDSVSLIYRLLAQLISERVSADTSVLYPIDSTPKTNSANIARVITVPVGAIPSNLPELILVVPQAPVQEAVHEALPPVPPPVEPRSEAVTPPPQEFRTPSPPETAAIEILPVSGDTSATPMPRTDRIEHPSPRYSIEQTPPPVQPFHFHEDWPAHVPEAPPPITNSAGFSILRDIEEPAVGPAAVIAAQVAVTAPQQPTVIFSPVARDWYKSISPYVEATVQSQSALAAAHDSFLRLQQGFAETATQALMTNNELLRRLLGQAESNDSTDQLAGPPRSLNTQACFEFARGRIGDVLGHEYAEIDQHPTRVRLPDGPLMLVDNILEIEGEPRSMKHGRVVTDHYVHADRWYLDAGRIPTCVAVESGQADLFLSGFLGIDFITKGHAVYRLLDAVVTFHRELPGVGDRIVYDIHIDEFFNQSDTWLFRFRFEATVNGQPLMSMQKGIAGFFTEAALAAGQGIVKSKIDQQPIPGKRSENWQEFVPFTSCSLNSLQVAALRNGDLIGAFGIEFRGLNLRKPMRLPGGMLKLLHRVPLIDPQGGRYGIGLIRAEYDIHPEDWFLTCHFVDDQVMPGTLMYECCLHTLRVFLMRMGWVGEEGEVVTQPIPGVSSRLKCRGQVIASTKLVTYEVSIRELGYSPEPFCIADALMFADGKPIVEITNMTLRMSGLSYDLLSTIWGIRQGVDPLNKPTLYDKAKILSYSNGNPSQGFGEPYRIFDEGTGRVIARLPGPPFQFVDRITAVTGEPFVLKAGASCEAEYEVPPNEWYFQANRCPLMPFSVLLEIALQPCGWLAAYCGSALTSPVDLSFRNLGGQATQFLPVGPDIGTITTNVTMTNVSQSAGMIIQHYSMKVTCSRGLVYEGTTYFGFFTKDALANQVGMPTAKVPFLQETDRQIAEVGELPREEPFPAPMLRMVDKVDGYLPKGGRAGLGLIQGSVKVDPSFWFFQAHFYQDPVWPGSLGLESFLQLAKYVAFSRWGDPGQCGWQTTALNAKHEWTYRGQVLPTDENVIVVLEVTAVNEQARQLTMDGFLTVDGRIIYQMNRFTLECS
jgi:acyl transferase domain-containing protein/3-hydroxymyristoyl/3-hydroxydecanoyl-(acyl carrier protein) dehydratase